MQPTTRAYLHDMAVAADLIVEHTADRTFSDYTADVLLRSLVERQFEIIGEATALLARSDAAVAAQITDYRRIIAFRNTLIHGYGAIDHQVVWNAVQVSLPMLRSEVAALLPAD